MHPALQIDDIVHCVTSCGVLSLADQSNFLRTCRSLARLLPRLWSHHIVTLHDLERLLPSDIVSRNGRDDLLPYSALDFVNLRKYEDYVGKLYIKENGHVDDNRVVPIMKAITSQSGDGQLLKAVHTLCLELWCDFPWPEMAIAHCAPLFSKAVHNLAVKYDRHNQDIWKRDDRRATVLSTLAKCEQLQTLSLDFPSIMWMDLDAFSNIFPRVVGQVRTLQKLHMRFVPHFFLPALAALPGLETLVIEKLGFEMLWTVHPEDETTLPPGAFSSLKRCVFEDILSHDPTFHVRLLTNIGSSNMIDLSLCSSGPGRPALFDLLSPLSEKWGTTLEILSLQYLSDLPSAPRTHDNGNHAPPNLFAHERGLRSLSAFTRLQYLYMDYEHARLESDLDIITSSCRELKGLVMKRTAGRDRIGDSLGMGHVALCASRCSGLQYLCTAGQLFADYLVISDVVCVCPVLSVIVCDSVYCDEPEKFHLWRPSFPALSSVGQLYQTPDNAFSDCLSALGIRPCYAGTGASTPDVAKNSLRAIAGAQLKDLFPALALKDDHDS